MGTMDRPNGLIGGTRKGTYSMLAEDVLMLKPPGPLADRNKAIASKGQGGEGEGEGEARLATYSAEGGAVRLIVLCDAGTDCR